MIELNKRAFADLIDEDREWLRYYTPRSLERQHIEAVLTDAIINFYKDKRIAELDAKIADIRDIAENTVEINMSNFNDDDVSEQNNALIEIWKVITESEGGADE